MVPGDGELLRRVRSQRAKLAKRGPVWIRGEGDSERVSLPKQDGDVLRDLFIGEQVRVAVEIGLAYGSSALAIAEALLAQGHGQGARVRGVHQGRGGGTKR